MKKTPSVEIENLFHEVSSMSAYYCINIYNLLETNMDSYFTLIVFPKMQEKDCGAIKCYKKAGFCSKHCYVRRENHRGRLLP